MSWTSNSLAIAINFDIFSGQIRRLGALDLQEGSLVMAAVRDVNDEVRTETLFFQIESDRFSMSHSTSLESPHSAL